MHPVIIGGLQKFSLSDFPGMISAIVFTRGCGFRCPYCHNPELVDPSRYAAEYPVTEILNFLVSRRGLLQGVVITGGEPTMHEDLPGFLHELKGLGFSVKLDTNGANPRLLQHVVAEGLVDFIAMDIKAPPALYAATVNAPVNMDDIVRSVEVVLGSGLAHEFRTTWVASLLTRDDIMQIARLVSGCDRYVLQSCNTATALDASLASRPARDTLTLDEICRVVSGAGFPVSMR